MKRTLLAALLALLFVANSVSAQVYTSVGNTLRYWVEANGTNVAANATLSGPARYNTQISNAVAPSATESNYGYFQVIIFTSQAGTFKLFDGSYTAGNGIVQTNQMAAGTYQIIKVPAAGSSFTVQFVNGATAGFVNIISMYTAN